jgi:hypothetical protein
VPAGASDNGDRAAVVRSAACVASPPGLVDGTEWVIPLPGRGQRRGVQVGEHVEVGHPLAVAFPGCFVDSAEPVDCWPIGLPSLETRKQREAEQRRLASHPCRKVTPACARCGAESEQSVIVFDQPTQLGLLEALSGLEDHDHVGRYRIESKYGAMARAAQEQEAELQRVEAAWRAEHQQCPEGTDPMPEPQVPETIPWVPWRLNTVRTLG